MALTDVWDILLLLLNCCYLTVGFASASLNAFALFAIIRANIAKRNNILLIVYALCASGFFQSSAYIVAAILRIPAILDNSAVCRFTQLECFLANILFYVTVPFAGFTMMLVAAERLYVVFWPAHYQHHSKAVMRIALGINLFVSVGITAAGFAGVNGTVVEICTASTGTHPTYYFAWLCVCRFSPVAFCCAAYSVLVIRLRQRNRRVSSNTAATDSSRDFRSRNTTARVQKQVAKMAATICLTYVALTAVGTVLISFVAPKMPTKTANACLVQSGSLLILINCLANVFIFGLRNQDVRKAMKETVNFVTCGTFFPVWNAGSSSSVFHTEQRTTGFATSTTTQRPLATVQA